MPSNLIIQIGDITTAVEWQSGQFKFDTPPAYQPFISDGRIDLRLRLHHGAPEFELGEACFDSPPIWRLHRNGEESALKIFDSYPDLRRILVLPPRFNRVDLYFIAPDGRFIDPFFGPTMELLMINYLPRGHGVIIHGCGIDYNKKGLLFAGESGAGKSTLAHLWNQEPGVDVLSDDRTLVRQIDGKLRMYGTPWHGEGRFGTPRGVKLEKIIFLRHAQQNSLRQMRKAESVTQLLKCSFPPFWDNAGMEFSMALFDKLANQLGCCELSFRPDGSAIDFVKRKILQVRC